MSQAKTQPDIAPPVNRIPKYAHLYETYAEEMLEEARDNDRISATEKLARVAGAELFMLYSAGKMHPMEAHKFLVEQFSKKTPSPVQKIEQDTKVDLNIMLRELVTDNPNILDMSTKKAIVARQDIQDKLDLPPTLALEPAVIHGNDPPADLTVAVTTESNGGSLPPAKTWTGEPDEIKAIRNPEEHQTFKGRKVTP